MKVLRYFMKCTEQKLSKSELQNERNALLTSAVTITQYNIRKAQTERINCETKVTKQTSLAELQ